MATVTKPIILNETYAEKMETLISILAGYASGAFPTKTLEIFEGEVEIGANVVNVIPELGGDVSIAFAPASSEIGCEWVFIISQGDTAYNVTLPHIEWYLGISPAFASNSMTEVRVMKVGDSYKGVWIA